MLGCQASRSDDASITPSQSWFYDLPSRLYITNQLLCLAFDAIYSYQCIAMRGNVHGDLCRRGEPAPWTLELLAEQCPFLAARKEKMLADQLVCGPFCKERDAWLQPVQSASSLVSTLNCEPQLQMPPWHQQPNTLIRSSLHKFPARQDAAVLSPTFT